MNDCEKLCYWLQGFVEINNKAPNKTQWKSIKTRVKATYIEDSVIDSTIMKPQSFIVWLLGFIELSDTDSVTTAQWEMIKEHLQLVFVKVTSVMDEALDNDDLAKKINDIFHDGKDKIWTQDPDRNPLEVTFPYPPRGLDMICNSTNDKFCSSLKDLACNVYEKDSIGKL